MQREASLNDTLASMEMHYVSKSYLSVLEKDCTSQNVAANRRLLVTNKKIKMKCEIIKTFRNICCRRIKGFFLFFFIFLFIFFNLNDVIATVNLNKKTFLRGFEQIDYH